jgi:hypothetical protein
VPSPPYSRSLVCSADQKESVPRPADDHVAARFRLEGRLMTQTVRHVPDQPIYFSAAEEPIRPEASLQVVSPATPAEYVVPGQPVDPVRGAVPDQHIGALAAGEPLSSSSS